MCVRALLRLRSLPASLALSLLALLSAAAPAQQATPERPPAVPLIAHNPYFSIWSFNNKLTDGPTRHWTGTPQPLTGLLRIDGHPYRYMGRQPREVPALPQTALTVAATHTDYAFEGAGIHLDLSFFTPAFPQDLDLLSRPVTYLTWTAHSTDGQPHDVSVLLDVSPIIAVDQDNQAVTWGRGRAGDLRVLNVGSRDQRPLNRSGDNLRIDWGYFHLAAPTSEQAVLANTPDAIDSFVQSGHLPPSDDFDMPQTPRDGAAHQAALLALGPVSATPVTRHVLLSYTQGFQIEYLERMLRPYWQRNGESVAEMLQAAESQYAQLDARGRSYDAALQSDLEKAGGHPYAEIATLAYRQTLAAHALVANLDGAPYLFGKENFSNGDIATVDVLYPSSPFFLFFNPALLEGQMAPVLRYAELPRWHFPFAPHDLGRFPLANGQEYGGGERTKEDQMPVEESGDLLILADALGRAEGDFHFARQHWPVLSKWAQYLRAKGLDPENQLSTDDFAGHLAHNANLSLKAIDAIGAYAQMAASLGKQDVASDYMNTARKMAVQWQSMAIDGDHYKLAFDKPGTWSQKYNLIWDDLLDLHLFPPKVRDTEMAFYLSHENKFGVPLDSRATYTKLDWEIWTATLAGSNQAEFQHFVAPIGTWVNETPSRVPMTDWYDTLTGKQQGFQARSVVGGVYIKPLADPALAQKWRKAGK